MVQVHLVLSDLSLDALLVDVGDTITQFRAMSEILDRFLATS